MINVVHFIASVIALIFGLNWLLTFGLLLKHFVSSALQYGNCEHTRVAFVRVVGGVIALCIFGVITWLYFYFVVWGNS